MNTAARWLWPLGGLGVALLLATTAPFVAIERAWLDLSLRSLAPTERAVSTAVLDIDAASLQALQPLHGPWPLPRELHARVAQRLLAAGARAVVFNLEFPEPRPGDEALHRLAQSGRRIVFGASLTPGVGGAGLHPPSASVRPESAPIGLMTLPLDDDGRLRCLPTTQTVGREQLPSLPVAAAQAAQGLGFASGCQLLTLPAAADAVPALSYAAFALADPAPELAARVRGRTVFIGSPSLLDAAVRTPQGEIGGTQWQALAHEGLLAGWVLAPPSWPLGAALAGLALLPLAWPRRALPLAALSAAAILALGTAVQAWHRELASVPLALLLLAGVLAGLALLRWRTLAADRAQARLAQAAAEAASRAKGEFLAHMSHEIRTPLNAVLGMAQLLAQTPLTSTQRRYVDVFASAGAHLQRLIDDVLDLSRVESGQLALLSESFEPRALADELTALFEARASAKGLGFALEVDPGLPRWVRGDRHRLRQALLNVLGNALKFTDSGRVLFSVRCGAALDEIEWQVLDTGIGVPPERLAQIFEPFTQADAGIARSHGGSGLGLAITRRLLQAMGGDIELQSRPGEGTQCRLRLPLPASDPPPALAAPADAPAPRWPGRRLLLAEDHPHNVLVVQGLLADCALQIEVVADGQAAVDRAAAGGLDLVLMDIQMPVLDGLAATRLLRAAERRADRPPLPVIALSANAMAADRQASLEAGCDAHLAKPLARGALFEVLAAFLGPPEQAGPPLLDRAAAVQRMGGDQALYDRVCGAARPQLAGWEAEFAAAAAAGDRERCRRLAHDLKGLAGTLGAAPLAASALALEAACAEPGADLVAARSQVGTGLQAVLQRLAEEARDD